MKHMAKTKSKVKKTPLLLVILMIFMLLPPVPAYAADFTDTITTSGEWTKLLSDIFSGNTISGYDNVYCENLVTTNGGTASNAHVYLNGGGYGYTNLHMGFGGNNDATAYDGTETLIFKASSPGTYTFGILGTDHGVTKTISITVTGGNCTMTFDSEGGSAVGDATVSNGGSVTKPGDPTKTGYTFAGWYDGDNGTGNGVSFPYTLTTNKTIYAKWTVNPYTITFDSEGGSTVSAVTQNYNTSVSAPTAPTKTGYVFGGWYDGDNGTGSVVNFPHTVAGDKTVYAKWTVEQDTLTFDSEGGSAVSAVTQNYNTSVSAPTAPTKTGYTFGGWYDGDNGTGNPVNFPYTLTSDKTIYAKWTVNPYTITFDSEGGSAVSAITQNYNTSVVAPTAPTKTGYTFGGWYDGDNGTGSVVNFPHTVAGDKTVYAKWTVEQDTLTFDSEGGSAVSAVTQNYNTSVSAPTAPTKTGYTFGGWYDGDNGTGNAVSFPYTLTSNKTVYAKWTVTPYTITFDSEGGSAVSAVTQNYNTSVVAPTAPTKTGYSFDGWYDGDNGTGSVVSFPHTVAGDKTVYAKWTVEQDTLTFDSEGGSAVSAVTQNYDTSVVAPTAPTKTGYTFEGWYDGDNGTGNAVSFPCTLTSNKTVYAKWTANPYTITFDSEGGSAVSAVTQNYNTTVSAPTAPTKTGYAFGGWYDGDNGTGSVVSFPHTVAGDKTVYAKWTVEQDTLTFDSEGGSAVSAVTQNYNTSVTVPTAPTKTGYTFGGWYDGDNGTGNVVNFPYTLTGNKTVYAKWNIRTYTVTYKNNYNNSDSTVYQSQNVLGIKVTTAPTAPVRAGYTFEGWYTNNSCTTAWNFKNDTVSSDMDLFAKWTVAPIIKYTVSYASNGASSGNVPVDGNEYLSGGTARISANTGSLAKAGYTFGGWNYNGTTYSAGQTVTITGDMTLNAVWTAVPATYTATYNQNYTGGNVYTTQSGISSGATLTSPADPVRASYTFIGWYKETACVNLWKFSTDTLKADTTLYAKWAANTYSVNGNVVDDQAIPTPISGATVKVIQGNTQFGNSTTTDGSGNFTIANIPDGNYNLVVSKDNQEVTVFITVSGGNYTYSGSIILPSGNKNTALDVIGSDTPNVVVDNLQTVFNDATVYGAPEQNTVSNGGTVEIKLTVQKNDTSANKATVEAAMSSGGFTSGAILDIDLTKTSTTSGGASEETSITATNNLIKIIIPLPSELQGKNSYVIYRAHDYGIGVVADAITTTANANGEYITVSGDKTQITAYLKYFSTYAIAFTNGGTTSSSHSSGGGSAAVNSYTVKATAGPGGSINPNGNVNVPLGQSKTFTISVETGYKILEVLVDGKSVGSVSSYTFTSIKEEHTIDVAFSKLAGLPYYLDDKGKSVFIGFASDVSGVMKYIAPKDKTILFKTNPKNFSDISEHWAKSAIEFVTERELFLGTGEDTFSPEKGMTRAMFTAALGRLYERSYGIAETNAGSSSFSDADYTAYYGNYVNWAAENNIVTGVGNGKFEPNRMVTREEMAVMLYRFADSLKLTDSENRGSLLSYPDAPTISSWAKDAAAYCQKTNIISGRSGGNFTPRGTATRAEVASILKRLIESTVQ